MLTAKASVGRVANAIHRAPLRYGRARGCQYARCRTGLALFDSSFTERRSDHFRRSVCLAGVLVLSRPSLAAAFAPEIKTGAGLVTVARLRIAFVSQKKPTESTVDTRYTHAWPIRVLCGNHHR
jgi:hypothetical protein